MNSKIPLELISKNYSVLFNFSSFLILLFKILNKIENAPKDDMSQFEISLRKLERFKFLKKTAPHTFYF